VRYRNRCLCQPLPGNKNKTYNQRPTLLDHT
jgi:hypothetical protein